MRGLGALRRVVSLAFLAGSALALYNIYGDNQSVVEQAEGVACGGEACVRTLRAERTAFAQSFTFQTSLTPPRTQSVRCARQYALVGPYSCEPVRD